MFRLKWYVSILCFMTLGTFNPLCSADTLVVITQADEDSIVALLTTLNQEFSKQKNVVDISIPIVENLLSFRSLKQYGNKVIPYVIRDIQRENESQVSLGSAVAGRKIASMEKLAEYNRERVHSVPDWGENADDIYWLLIRIAPKALREFPLPDTFSWIGWWGQNRGLFAIHTKRPVEIDIREKYSNQKRIDVRMKDSLLDIDGIRTPFRQLVQAVAKKCGKSVDVCSEHFYDLPCRERMRSVTFDEFIYLFCYQHSLTFKKDSLGIYHLCVPK